jgi:hypothetical protein
VDVQSLRPLVAHMIHALLEIFYGLCVALFVFFGLCSLRELIIKRFIEQVRREQD